MPLGVVAVRFVDARRQRGMHVTGLDADGWKLRLDQAGVKPRRERTRFQADPAVGETQPEQVLTDHLGITLDTGAVNDPTLWIEDANGGLLHGDIEADEVLLGHGTAPSWFEPPSCRRFRSGTRPEYPIWAPPAVAAASST
jgi:hypothetical protein